MAKKVYVDGSILIKTSDFKYEGAGALFDIPEDAETIEPNEVIDGVPFLVIDDTNIMVILQLRIKPATMPCTTAFRLKYCRKVMN